MAKNKKHVNRPISSAHKNKFIPPQSPSGKKHIVKEISPTSFMTRKPTWNFCRVDKEYWTIHNDFVDNIMPALINFESMTWHDILSASKGHGSGSKNHMIETSNLIKTAQERLEVLHIYEDTLISLRLTGEKRLWGIMDSGIFNILWYDKKHEICPSHKRHT